MLGGREGEKVSRQETPIECRRVDSPAYLSLNAAVNGKLELTLLKGRQRFDTVSMSNLKVYKFQEW